MSLIESLFVPGASGVPFDASPAAPSGFGLPSDPPPTAAAVPSDPNAPPPPDPRIGQFLDLAQQLHAKAAGMAPPNYPGMSVGQALVGVAGALATSDNPHAQFVAQYMPALADAVQRQFGNREQAWQAARQNLLDQANLYQQRAAGIQQYQADVYKAQMGVYGQQLRGLGAAEVRTAAPDARSASGTDSTTPPPTVPPDPSAVRMQMLKARGVPSPVATPYLTAVSRLPDAEAASWVGGQASADQFVDQAAKVLSSAPGGGFDLGRALFTRDSIGSVAQALRNQVPALRSARMALVAQQAAVSPASDAARNLQSGIDQYDQAIRANGVQLDRLAGASKQISDAIARRAAGFVAPPTVLPSSSPTGAPSRAVTVTAGANAVNLANGSRPLTGAVGTGGL